MGGVFYFLNIKTVRINGNTFDTFSAETDGSCLYSTATTMDLDIRNNKFYAQSAAYDISVIWPKITASTSERGGIIYIKGNKAAAIV